MSTPTPPDGPDEAPTTEHAAVEDHQPVAPAAPAPPPGPYAAPPAGPLGYHPYPFAPRIREPWVNPAKRGALALVAVGLAIVLLAGGFVVGAAVAHHRDRGYGIRMREFPGRVGGYGMPARGPYGYVPGGRAHVLPGFRPPGQVAPAPTQAPTQAPAPTTGPTSSHR